MQYASMLPSLVFLAWPPAKPVAIYSGALSNGALPKGAFPKGAGDEAIKIVATGLVLSPICAMV